MRWVSGVGAGQLGVPGLVGVVVAHLQTASVPMRTHREQVTLWLLAAHCWIHGTLAVRMRQHTRFAQQHSHANGDVVAHGCTLGMWSTQGLCAGRAVRTYAGSPASMAMYAASLDSPFTGTM